MRGVNSQCLFSGGSKHRRRSHLHYYVNRSLRVNSPFVSSSFTHLRHFQSWRNMRGCCGWMYAIPIENPTVSSSRPKDHELRHLVPPRQRPPRFTSWREEVRLHSIQQCRQDYSPSRVPHTLFPLRSQHRLKSQDSSSGNEIRRRVCTVIAPRGGIQQSTRPMFSRRAQRQ